MGVESDRGDAGGCGHVAQVLAQGWLIDGKVGVEGKQDGGDDPMGDVALVPGHGLTSFAATQASQIGPHNASLPPRPLRLALWLQGGKPAWLPGGEACLR